jgi:hypothetical protein
MRILFDHGTPAPLIPFLEGHTVTKAKDAGWDKLANGELLKAAEEAEFELLVTTDKNMAAQQNLKGRAIAMIQGLRCPVLLSHHGTRAWRRRYHYNRIDDRFTARHTDREASQPGHRRNRRRGLRCHHPGLDVHTPA